MGSPPHHPTHCIFPRLKPRGTTILPYPLHLHKTKINWYSWVPINLALQPHVPYPYALHLHESKTNGYAATWDHHHTIPLWALHLHKTKTNGYQATWDPNHTIPLYALHLHESKNNGYAATWDHQHTYPLHFHNTKTNG